MNVFEGGTVVSEQMLHCNDKTIVPLFTSGRHKGIDHYFLLIVF